MADALAGARLLNCPSTLNAANTQRPRRSGPPALRRGGETGPELGGQVQDRTVSGMSQRAASATAQTPR